MEHTLLPETHTHQIQPFFGEGKRDIPWHTDGQNRQRFAGLGSLRGREWDPLPLPQSGHDRLRHVNRPEMTHGRVWREKSIPRNRIQGHRIFNPMRANRDPS
jgi:hypothetical protein